MKAEFLRFKFSYVIIPFIILAISIIIAAIFYSRLPAEVVYSFDLHGAPVGSASKGGTTALFLGLELAVLLLSALVIWSFTRISAFNKNRDDYWFNPEKVLALMGNMPGIIQIILAYAFVDMIIYNINQSHVIALWLFSVLALVIGGIISLVYALPIIRQAWQGFNGTQGTSKKE